VQSTLARLRGVFVFGDGFPTSGQAGSLAESSGFDQHLLDVLVALLGNGHAHRIALSAELFSAPHGPQSLIACLIERIGLRLPNRTLLTDGCCNQVSMTGIRSQTKHEKRSHANHLFAVSCASFQGRP